MNESCPMCDLLWRKYIWRTSELVAVNNRVKLACLKQDVMLVLKLTAMLQKTAMRREQANDAFHLHKMTVHGEATKCAVT